MELFEKEEYYIIKNGEFSLWCSRADGSMEPKRGPCYDNLELIVRGYITAVSLHQGQLNVELGLGFEQGHLVAASSRDELTFVLNRNN